MTDKGYSTSSYLGALITLVGGLSTEQRIALAGLLLGLLTFLLNVWRQYRSDRREQREHEIRIRNMQIETSRPNLECVNGEK